MENPRSPLTNRWAIFLIVVVSFACCTQTSAWQNASRPIASDNRTRNAKSAKSRFAVPPAKVRRYVERVIALYDQNGDDQLQPDEWNEMRGEPATMDLNRDGNVSADEFLRYVTVFAARRRIRLESPAPPAVDAEPALLQPITAPTRENRAAARNAAANDTTSQNRVPAAAAAGNNPAAKSAANQPTAAASAKPINRRRDTKFFVPATRLQGLPSWFHSRDRNGDGQISMAEYSPSIDQTALVEFRRYDRNGDGFITPKEYLDRVKPKKTAKSTATTNRPATANRSPIGKRSSSDRGSASDERSSNDTRPSRDRSSRRPR